MLASLPSDESQIPIALSLPRLWLDHDDNDSAREVEAGVSISLLRVWSQSFRQLRKELYSRWFKDLMAELGLFELPMK